MVLHTSSFILLLICSLIILHIFGELYPNVHHCQIGLFMTHTISNQLRATTYASKGPIHNFIFASLSQGTAGISFFWG